MRFTEHELTAALTGAAKTVVAARPGRGRRARAQDPDAAWEALGRFERFQVLDALGEQVLPVLVALPDVDVAPGTRPSYDDRTVQAVVEGLVGDEVGKLRRAVLVRTRTALVQTALAAVPPRLDPDALLHGDGPA